MKKLLTSIFVMVCLIACSVSTVLADNGGANINIPFIVITCVLAPVLVGVIVYYAIRAKKQKQKVSEDKTQINIVRDYDDEI